MADVAFLADKHEHYLRHYEDDKESLEHMKSEQMRMGGLYWGTGSMALLGRLDDSRKTEDLDFITKCLDPAEPGGIGANIGHDADVTSTHHALLVCCIYDELDRLNIEKLARFMASRQQLDGSFAQYTWGEVDIRVVYCGISCLTILDKLDLIDVDATVAWILRCQNYDGGFGTLPRSESHGYATWAAVHVLAMLDSLDAVDLDAIGWWLCERQTPGGGFNGRPEKAPDICYSWWIFSAMHVIDRAHWIDAGKLGDFIFKCQDDETGGLADRPADVPDVFHTFFGLCGLSLLGRAGIKPIHPVYALPQDVVRRMSLPPIVDGDVE